MNILKSIGALLAGIIFIVITHNVTDLILEALGIFTPPTVRFDTTWMVVTAAVYRTLFTVGGAYITAGLAPSRAMLHAVILGIIGAVLGAVGAVMLIPLDLGPAWYPIALAALALPSCWLGGIIYTSRMA